MSNNSKNVGFESITGAGRIIIRKPLLVSLLVFLTAQIQAHTLAYAADPEPFDAAAWESSPADFASQISQMYRIEGEREHESTNYFVRVLLLKDHQIGYEVCWKDSRRCEALNGFDLDRTTPLARNVNFYRFEDVHKRSVDKFLASSGWGALAASGFILAVRSFSPTKAISIRNFFAPATAAVGSALVARRDYDEAHALYSTFPEAMAGKSVNYVYTSTPEESRDSDYLKTWIQHLQSGLKGLPISLTVNPEAIYRGSIVERSELLP